MFVTRRASLGIAAAAVPGLMRPAPGLAQSNAIRAVCGSSPGSITDLIARIMQPGLAQRLARPVVVDNRPGAGGNIAAAFVAQAPADGNTIMIVSGGIMTLNPHLYRDMPFNPLQDIKLITRLTNGGFLLAVPSASGITDVAGLVAHLKRKGDAANFGSAGIGFVPHLGAEMFLAATGAEATHVPYRGSAGAINALVSGEVDFLFDSRGPLLPHLQSGAVRVIANGGSLPDIVYPDLPMLSATLPGVIVQSWTALAGPAGLPDAMVRRLDAATRETLEDPETAARLRNVGNGPAYLGPDGFIQFYADERQRAARAVEIAKVSPQ